MTLGPFQPCTDDLAPGDRGVLDASWESFTLERLRSPRDEMFDEAFGRLWREFGERGEMERREVIEDRLAWDPRRPVNGHALLYEMLVVKRDHQVVAIRDHTAIVTPAVLAGEAGAGVVVHLSHVLVEPSMRGRGLASWLRALPVETARRCLALARSPRAQARGDAGAAAPGEDRRIVADRDSIGAPAPAPGITLVAEMEHDDGETPAVVARLRSYAKAGFRVVDPRRVPYSQPDFRSAAEIDRSGVRPVPLCLVLRRVGRENEFRITGEELRGIVGALQAMFAVHVRADHMESVRELAAGMPSAGDEVDLLVPGSPSTLTREAIR